MPAIGPAPDETPKAKANGKATMAAVIPPYTSPRIFLNSVLFTQISPYLGLALAKSHK